MKRSISAIAQDTEKVALVLNSSPQTAEAIAAVVGLTRSQAYARLKTLVASGRAIETPIVIPHLRRRGPKATGYRVSE